MHISHTVRLLRRTLNENSPTILSGLAVAGVVATAVLAVRATPAARLAILDAKQNKEYAEASREERAVFDQEKAETQVLTHVELVKATWRAYLPAVVTGTATIACIIGSNQIGVRRNAAMLGAYTLADTAFREYKSEVLEQIGAAKERKITDEIAKRKIDEHPVSDAQVIITGGGDQLCYDTLTGRYFRSDIEKIRRAENDFNREILRNSQYASLNEFYAYFGLGATTLGEELGFDIEHPVELVFSSHLANDGVPCLAMGFTKLPIKDYGKF